MRVTKILLVATAVATIVGCQVTHVAVKSPGLMHSPPPTYGYYKRYPHHHRYDSDLGLYIYLQSPDTYYHNNYYYRWSVRFNYWERTHEPKGSWRRVNAGLVPTKLVKRRAKHKIHRPAPATIAPAYGYYSSHQHLHRWDNELGLYIFIESPNTYYNKKHYIRWSDRFNRWERADEPRGGWRQLHERDVPSKLLKKRLKKKSRQLDKREKRLDREKQERRSDRREEYKREIEKEHRSEGREVIKDKKESKKGRKTKKREYLEECEERGNSGKCRD